MLQIFNGLKTIPDNDMQRVDMESGSENAVMLINGGQLQNSLHMIITEECTKMLNRSNSSIGHTQREGNGVADRLAKISTGQGIRIVNLGDYPNEIWDVLVADVASVALIC